MLNQQFDLTRLAAYLGSVMAMWDGWTLADASILVGIVTALLSSVANLVYTYRKDRREQRASDAAAARLEKDQ
ncbi:HP1 family phage holin [Massilia sp. YIM B02443]|uniref:HP1 family phage holin n=1 Tax=Massilia sp. YIM B02443 TaxID=3050127 RepID=UPI0025B728BC|nr:HP1 family phage holin [Massilia sp. YIM B02443]